MNPSPEARVRQAAARLFPTGRALVPLGCGGNSRVFRLLSADGPVVLKAYARPTMDGRSRLDVEFSSLRLLEELGLTGVPRALAADPETQVGAYSLLDGVCPDPSQAGEKDIDAMVAFLARLQALRDRPPCRALPEAAEARFSLAAVVETIHSRLSRLREATGGEEPMALREFLDAAFVPGLDRVVGCARRLLGPAGFAASLPQGQRVLSPSDFGLHNALRTSDGGLVFVDFEYFGWDDPAKTLADVCLHPAMGLPPGLRRRFVEGFREQVGLEAPDALRFRAALPVFALKWCLIFLNVFLPGFGPDETAARADLRRARLDAARTMLARALTASTSPCPELEDA